MENIATDTVASGKVVDSRDDLPAIWIYSAMTDRLRRTDREWRILKRHVVATRMNNRLHVCTSDPAYLDPYLPGATTR